MYVWEAIISPSMQKDVLISAGSRRRTQFGGYFNGRPGSLSPSLILSVEPGIFDAILTKTQATLKGDQDDVVMDAIYLSVCPNGDIMHPVVDGDLFISIYSQDRE